MTTDQYLDYDESSILRSIKDILTNNFMKSAFTFAVKTLNRELNEEEIIAVEDLVDSRIEDFIFEMGKDGKLYDLSSDIELDIEDMEKDIVDEVELMDELDEIEIEEEINTFGLPKVKSNIEQESELGWDETE